MKIQSYYYFFYYYSSDVHSKEGCVTRNALNWTIVDVMTMKISTDAAVCFSAYRLSACAVWNHKSLVNVSRACSGEWSGTNYKLPEDKINWFKNTSSRSSLKMVPSLMNSFSDREIIWDGMSPVLHLILPCLISKFRDLEWKDRRRDRIEERTSYSIRNNLIFYTIIK